jgi:hypothetical protein
MHIFVALVTSIAFKRQHLTRLHKPSKGDGLSFYKPPYAETPLFADVTSCCAEHYSVGDEVDSTTLF